MYNIFKCIVLIITSISVCESWYNYKLHILIVDIYIYIYIFISFH